MAIKPLSVLAIKPAQPTKPATPAKPAKPATPAKPAKPAAAPKPEKKANPVKLRGFRVEYTYVDKHNVPKVGAVKKMAKDADSAKKSVELDLARGDLKNTKVGTATPESE